MKLHMTLLALSALLMAFQASAADQTKPFSYRVEVPAGAAGCQTHAASVADLFATAAGIPVDSSSCTTETITDNGATFTKDVIIINYHANYAASPYRAVFGGDVNMSTSSDFTSLFSHYADCVNALPAQTQAFTANTGLTAVAGHCDSPSEATNTGFVLTVEGFGTPALRLYAFQRRNDVFGPSSTPEVMAAVQQMLVNEQAMVTYSDASRVFYYAKRSIAVDVTEPADFNVSSDCTSQLDEARAIYTNAGDKSVQAFCLKSSDTSTVTGHLAIVTDGGSLAEGDLGQNSAHYQDFASCMADKARVMQNAVSSGVKALGALCEPEGLNTEYRLNLYVSEF